MRLKDKLKSVGFQIVDAFGNTRAVSYIKAGLLLAVLIFVLGFGAKIPPVIEWIDVSDQLNEDNTVTLSVGLRSSWFTKDSDIWCYFGEEENIDSIPDDAWVPAQDGVCTVHVDGGNYFVYAKDAVGNISLPDEQMVEINKVVAVQLNKDTLYLAVDGHEAVEADLFVLGDADDTIKWSTSDASVASVLDGVITAHSVGTATISATAEDITETVDVTVTDMIIPMPGPNELNYGSKERIPANKYSEEDNDFLDEVLKTRVENAGYGTRAGALASARFLTLEFPYLVPYFYENGRLEAHGSKNTVDGEGRYYHEGLYLHESRYEGIRYSLAGPAYWGAPLTNYENAGYFTSGQRYPNGFSCSGFITWCLINGGTDVGDVGAGNYEYRDDDLCDIGVQVPVTLETMYSGKVKAGDLIGTDGHIAMIVGLDETYIYIGESIGRGVRITKLRIADELIYNPEYTYIMLMDTVYEGEGNYTEMW